MKSIIVAACLLLTQMAFASEVVCTPDNKGVQVRFTVPESEKVMESVWNLELKDAQVLVSNRYTYRGVEVRGQAIGGAQWDAKVEGLIGLRPVSKPTEVVVVRTGPINSQGVAEAKFEIIDTRTKGKCEYR